MQAHHFHWGIWSLSPYNPPNQMTQSGKTPLEAPLVQRWAKKLLRVCNRKWGCDLSLLVIILFCALFLLSSPLWRLSVNAHCLFQRAWVLTGAPWSSRDRKDPQPPPSPFSTTISLSSWQAQAQIRDLDTLAKPSEPPKLTSTYPLCMHQCTGIPCL